MDTFREGNGNPPQYSCLEKPMGGGAWWATVHGVTKSQTQLSTFTFSMLESGMCESPCNSGDPGLIPRLGRSPGEGNDYPLQYSCLENTMDRGAWWATVHGVTKSRTQLSDFTLTISIAGLLNSHLRSLFQTQPILESICLRFKFL